MELVETNVPLDYYPQWLGNTPPQSASHLICSSSAGLSDGKDENINQDTLQHSSMKAWTSTFSTGYTDDETRLSILKTSSQILERIMPVESDSFRSAKEMFHMREERNLTREYSLRQTYSFLNEMSASSTQANSIPENSPRKYTTRTKSMQNITLPAADAWSPPYKQTAESLTKYSRYGRPTTDDALQVSLEKNKHAAAKCRIKKNIQTDKLRKSVHTAVAANSRLRQEVMDKMEEIQLLHTEVLRHAVDSGCNAPHELRNFLCSGEAQAMAPDNPAAQGQHSAEHADEKNTSLAAEHSHRHMSPIIITKRRSEAPSPPCGIDRFKHASAAYQLAERKLRTQLSEP